MVNTGWRRLGKKKEKSVSHHGLIYHCNKTLLTIGEADMDEHVECVDETISLQSSVVVFLIDELGHCGKLNICRALVYGA